MELWFYQSAPVKEEKLVWTTKWRLKRVVRIWCRSMSVKYELRRRVRNLWRWCNYILEMEKDMFACDHSLERNCLSCYFKSGGTVPWNLPMHWPAKWQCKDAPFFQSLKCINTDDLLNGCVKKQHFPRLRQGFWKTYNKTFKGCFCFLTNFKSF